jgi:hypothetical protein
MVVHDYNPSIRRQRQENGKFEANLGYLMLRETEREREKRELHAGGSRLKSLLLRRQKSGGFEASPVK